MTGHETAIDVDVAINIGARFVSEGDFGTVKYIGEVPPTSGLWLGVEWENADRGKHDGSHKGIRYFECNVADSGSFIRAKKADFGVDFSKALSDRYIAANLDTGDIDTSMMYVKDINNKMTVVEMVGASMIAKKQSSTENLQDVDVRDTRISNAGTEDLTKMLPNITQLNLSKNLLPSWEEVAKITHQLPKLTLLNVSDNRLAIPEELSSLTGAFDNVQELVLNNMDISWHEVTTCASMWPQVRQLFLCYNNISELHRLPPVIFQHLELINVESNQISDWRQVNLLGNLPKLQSLLIGYNPLTSIVFCDVPSQHKTTLFPHLEMLSISHCKINQWQSINELDKLQTLKDLRYKKNPIVEDMSQERAEEMVIAKISTLKAINRCQIFEDDRKGAELSYLKKFGAEWLKSGGSRNPAISKPTEEFLQNHPRYEKLVQLYGAAEDSELRNKMTALKDSLIALTIKCPDDSSKKVLTKKLPGGMEITKLKSLLHRLYKVDVSLLRLSYISQTAGHEIELENDLRQMSYYSIESGDTILVRW